MARKRFSDKKLWSRESHFKFPDFEKQNWEIPDSECNSKKYDQLR
jgi:hypothetical protein